MAEAFDKSKTILHSWRGTAPPGQIADSVTELAAFLSQALALPPRAGADALHIAIATVHGMDYLLTWNCTHIANAELRLLVERACRKQGYMAPIMCTPEELTEELTHDYTKKE